jgi:hypothetical protein
VPRTRSRPTPVYGPEIRDSLVDAIRAANRPLKPVEIGKCAGVPQKVPGAEVVKLLALGLKAIPIFNWGPAKSPVYWHRDPEKVAEERLASIAGAEPLVEAELLKRAMAIAPKIGMATLRSAKTRLFQGKRFRLEGPKGKKIVVDTQHPEPFLEMEISQLLQSFGRALPAARIRALVVEGAQAEPPAENQVQDVAEKMFAAMNRIAFSPGASVTFYRLRQQPELAHVPKAIFDRAALLLESERRALLSIHDHAAALPAEERERFVTDGLGAYYVSIYAR